MLPYKLLFWGMPIAQKAYVATMVPNKVGGWSSQVSFLEVAFLSVVCHAPP